MPKMIYQGTVYFSGWANRRLFFPTREAAIEWATKEYEDDPAATEVWLTTINTERTGSYGALEIEENIQIL